MTELVTITNYVCYLVASC